MKTLMSVLVLASGVIGLTAGACPAPEAQFIATVSSVQPTDVAGVCKVEFSQIQLWNENMLCPLDVEETRTQTIEASCGIKPGDQASGILTQAADGRLSW